MTAAEKLISVSTLTGCDTAANHFCSISAGGGEVRVYGEYPVKYVPTEPSKFIYVKPKSINIQYVQPKSMKVEYVPPASNEAEYVPPPTIKIN